MFEKLDRFSLRGAAAHQEGLSAGLLGEIEGSILTAQAGGQDLAHHFALGLLAPPGFACE